MATPQTDTGELFLSRLSETFTCRPGDNVLVECYVRHQRVKSIVWYVNGELVEARGFRIWHRYQPRTGQCTLHIRSVMYSDDGLYCCEATSIDDVVETLEIKLKIENQDKTWTKIPVLQRAGRIISENEDKSSTIFLISNNQTSFIDENMFPIHWYELRIDRPLLDPTISLENTSLQLSCRIAGLHIDKFEWYRNGELIAVCTETPPSSLTTTITGEIDRGVFHASYDTLPAHFIALLTIDSTTKQRHEGTYECQASNAYYNVSSSCEVIIEQNDQEQLPADEIISSHLITETKKRTDDDRQEQTLPIEAKRLRIDEITNDRQSQYYQPLTISPVESPFRTIGDQLVPSADNKKETTKTVKWNEQIETFHKKDSLHEIDTLLPPIPEAVPSSSDESSSVSAGDLEQILRSHSLLSTHAMEKNVDTSSSSDTGTESLGMCPVFFQLLPSKTECEEGERLLLSCQVMAGIQCQIKWLINDMIIFENKSRTRRHYNPDTGICFMIIDPTIITDTGIYRLIISNRHGQAQSTCQVQISNRQLPPMPEDDLSTRLYFIKPLPSIPITCRDGDTIQLSCVVHGRRPIHIRWFKDEQQISINDKQQHTRQIYFDCLTGKSTLTIHDIYPNDSGVYRCEANNEQGTANTTTTVDVTHYQYEVDSEMSSASFASSPPSDHEDITGSQSYRSIDENALYEESHRLVEELDARIADLSSGTTTIIEDIQQQQQQQQQYGKIIFF
ncbi:unnamed protein product [Rotaria sp. Silwood2]|nr:unnamed protein product [Rotaria sp. Silwood2]CAF2617745.1 unnamed protein product [Rotaria sp. Silwood2]CAF2839434.1 unnamed protein product [Rotaria sp. Silwood2]CAF3011837.1 unnamed protein product [Rotaria sp. Silwood2]CAF3936910.1 unnamed protein product [Rotaria sp. Silwood2]